MSQTQSSFPAFAKIDHITSGDTINHKEVMDAATFMEKMKMQYFSKY
jgi:hypothetical protein